MLMTRPRLISPTPVAAIALAILAFMAPCSRADARTSSPDREPYGRSFWMSLAWRNSCCVNAPCALMHQTSYGPMA